MKPKYLIIAGTSKAATTSLFNYFADHPEICPSYIKQSNYFLDIEIQEKLKSYSSYPYSDETLEYENYFKCNTKEKFRLEATPDYMFYDKTIERLKAFTEKNSVKIIVILRNPVSRFKSWYNFGKQQGILEENISFERFYYLAKNFKGDDNPCYMAHKTGFNSEYLSKFLSIKENLEIFFYEDLIANTPKFILGCCKRLNIDSGFYKDYDFKRYNETVSTRFKFITDIYNGFRSFYIKFLFKGFLGVKIGNFLKTIFSPIYKKVNTKKLKMDITEDHVFKRLKEDYMLEKEKLEQMFNLKNIPW